MAARDDLGAVDGNARHVGNLVGQDGAIDQAHKEEGDDKQPKRRALLDTRPADANLGRRVLVLIASRRDGRIARVLAERLKADLGRLGAEGVSRDGQCRHHADGSEYQERRAPAHTHDKRAHDRRENGSAKARARKCDGNGKAAFSGKPVGGHKANEQTGRGHSEAARNGKEHVDLPQLTDKAHAGKHRRGSDNGKRAQYAATHLIGNMTDNERTHDTHHGGDGIGDVVLRKGNTQVADDQRLEQAHAVDENRVTRGHDHEAGGHHEPAGEELTLLGHTAPFRQTNSLRRAPVVPKIALKDKGIGLTAMPAGLKGKVGCYRWSAI